MTKRLVTAALLTASLTLLGTASAAHAVETRQFTGDGSSSFGLAYYYAQVHAERQAANAGFTDCVEIFSYIWPGGSPAMVIIECTR